MILAENNTSIVYQIINIKNFQGKKFTYTSKAFIERNNNNAGAIPIVFSLKDGKILGKPIMDMQQMSDSFKPNEWFDYTISGSIDKEAESLAFGFYFSGKAKFYFNDIVLNIKNNHSQEPIYQSDFKDKQVNNWYFSEPNSIAKLSISEDKKYAKKPSFFIDNSQAGSDYILGDNPDKGKYEEINGVRLYYEVYGTGPDLILLHGNNESIFSFNMQVEELAKHFRVIAIDTRCQGKSTCNDEKLTYELFAEDVHSLMEKLNLKKANILGWSDGANTGIILAEKYPAQVAKLAILSAVLFNSDESVDKRINRLLQKRIDHFKVEGMKADDVQYRLTHLLLTEPHLKFNDLHEIKIPVLVMSGQNDFIKQSHTELIAKTIKNSSLKIFKDSGHEVPKEKPQEFNTTVIEFFNKK
ncbi:alpha/beta hydrolase [Chryseobacterium sp. MYb264]|uniref:alpha/beta fold hydrolase n=1 Tax=Chryseobacterium sp. MYb264 TaxID=2745153 RepID=UPI002E1187D7|nr:alpha/beta hydrolase [Chryseobacterium sp. MYb264]